MYGVTSLGGTSANRKASDLFRVNDVVTFLNPSGPAVRVSQFNVVSAIGISNTLSFVAVPGTITANDYVVFANNLENATLAGGTEYNQNLVGLLDVGTSTSIHSVSGSTYPQWKAAVNNSAGGRFTTVSYQTLKDAIYNKGGGELDMVIWANGVKRDVVSQLTAGLRFTDAFALELDGQAGAKGVTFNTSRRVPDGYVFGFVKKNSINRMTLLPEPGQLSFDDLYKLQDQNGLVGSLDYPCQLITTNRANFGLYSGLTQS
jgi:hypothetical protein